jgi:hypothetical protein
VGEEKKRHEKEDTANAFYDLTKKAIEIDESMDKAKAIESRPSSWPRRGRSCWLTPPT